MHIMLALLKIIAIGFLLILLIGSGACVVFDISLLMSNFFSESIFLIFTIGALVLASGAAYGMYVLIRSFGKAPTASEQISRRYPE